MATSTWRALVAPRKNTTDYPGWCLRFAQSFFGAPARYASAWEAWGQQKYRHGPEVPLPNVPVLVWFEHWGNYGSPPTYGNWGHVAIHVPGDAVYTSPLGGSARGQGRYASIADMARHINVRYVGWSEDINGLRVAQSTTVEEDDMYSDADRARDNKTASQVNSIFRAIFEIDVADFKVRPKGIGREILNSRKERDQINSVFRSIFEIDIEDFEVRPNGIGREILNIKRELGIVDEDTEK